MHPRKERLEEPERLDREVKEYTEKLKLVPKPKEAKYNRDNAETSF